MKPPKVRPSRQAVALSYEASKGAPRVSAKGKGLIAENIIALAKENGIYVHESRELVGMLMQVELDHQIPPLLYVAIAELLAWLWKIENKRLDELKEAIDLYDYSDSENNSEKESKSPHAG